MQAGGVQGATGATGGIVPTMTDIDYDALWQTVAAAVSAHVTADGGLDTEAAQKAVHEALSAAGAVADGDTVTAALDGHRPQWEVALDAADGTTKGFWEGAL